MQIRPVAAVAAASNTAAPAALPPVPSAPAAAAAAGPSPAGFEHTGTLSFVSRDGRYGYIDSPAFRSVFVWQTALETPGELRVGQRVEFEAGGVGWDPNHVEAVRARIIAE